MVAVSRVSRPIMFHGFLESFNVICAGRQITHELFTTFLACHLRVLNSIEVCATEVNDKDLVVYEEILLELFLVRIRKIHQ